MFPYHIAPNFGVTDSSALRGLLRYRSNPLIGQDGNVFNLIGLAARTLRQHGLTDQAKEMTERAFGSGSYSEALGVIMDYVNVTSVEDDMDEDEDWCREPEYDEDDWADEDQGFGRMGGMA